MYFHFDIYIYIIYIYSTNYTWLSNHRSTIKAKFASATMTPNHDTATKHTLALEITAQQLRPSNQGIIPIHQLHLKLANMYPL